MKKHSLFLTFYLLPLFGQFLYAPLLFADTKPKKIEIKQTKPTKADCIDPRKDKEIVRSAIAPISRMDIDGKPYKYYDNEVIDFIDKSFLKDRKFILSTDHINIYFIDKSLSDDREVVTKMVSDIGISLEDASSRLKKDKAIVRLAISNDSRAIYYADESLTKDKQMTLFAVKKSGNSFKYVNTLKYVDTIFKKDKEVVLAAVNQHGMALEYADDSLKKDKEVVLAAVKNNGEAIKFADPRFLDDKEVALAAVGSNGIAIDYMNKRFRADKDIFLKIAQTNVSYFDFSFADKDFLKSLSKDRNFVLKLAKISKKYFLYFLDPSLKKDKEIVMLAVKKRGSELCSADPELTKDKEIVLAAINQNGNSLGCADERFKRDKAMVLLVIEHGFGAHYTSVVDISLRNDPEILETLLKKYPGIVWLIYDYINDDPRFDPLVIEALRKSPSAHKYVSDRIKKQKLFENKEFVLSIVKEDGGNIKYASDNLKKDVDVIREAVKTFPMALEYAVPCPE